MAILAKFGQNPCIFHMKSRFWGSQIWPILGPLFEPLLRGLGYHMFGFWPKRGQKGVPKWTPKWPLGPWPGPGPQGAKIGGPRPETPDFHVQNGQNPGSGPWAPDLGPRGLYTTVYRGNRGIWPWEGPGALPGALFLYVHSGEIEKRPTFTRWLLFS